MDPLLSDEYLTSGAEKPLTDAEQHASDKAHNAMDAIEAELLALIKRLDDFTRRHPEIHVGAIDYEKAVGTIEDAMTDLFYEAWSEYERITGEREIKRTHFPKRGTASDLLFAAFRPMTPEQRDYLTGKTDKAPSVKDVEADFDQFFRSNN